MKYREKESNGRTADKYQQKPRGRFNFDWDPENINYRTQIPELPSKPKNKPDEKTLQRKLQQLQKQSDILKKERKQKKVKIQEQTKEVEQNINELKYNVELGEKCIKILQHDRQELQKSILDLSNKIKIRKRDLNNLRKEPVYQDKKEYKEMTYQQLRREQQRLLSRMSTATLTKKQEAAINSKITEISRFKINAPKPQRVQHNNSETEIADLRNKVERCQHKMNEFKEKLNEVEMKIAAIESDIEQFRDQIEEHNEELKNTAAISALQSEAQQIKQKIYKNRQEREQAERNYQTRLAEFEYQQENIKWIEWATEVQEKKNQEWEEQKQRKKKQMKYKQGTTDKKEDNKNQEEGTERKKFERPKMNQYQNLIDNCSFLISYCKDLYPRNNESKNAGTKEEVNIEQVLKKGQWSKMKGVQVIVPKKNKNSDKRENQKTIKTPVQKEEKQNQKFNHQFFVDQMFEKVNVLSPSNAQQLDNTIQSLQTKQQYYLEHPDGDQQDKKPFSEKYAPEKYTKTKQQSKKVINREDFPSLT